MAAQKERVMARRKHTREFKVSAVQLVTQQGYSAAQAAKSLGVDPGSVRYWVQKLSGEAGAVPAGDGAVQIELRRLRKENARLQIERDILKKAAAFFAREQT
jgi:transposase